MSHGNVACCDVAVGPGDIRDFDDHGSRRANLIEDLEIESADQMVDRRGRGMAIEGDNQFWMPRPFAADERADLNSAEEELFTFDPNFIGPIPLRVDRQGISPRAIDGDCRCQLGSVVVGISDVSIGECRIG